MGPANCAVVGCHNSTAKLKKWKEMMCEIHNILQNDCGCEPPFRLYMFPSEKRNGHKRIVWIRLMKRENVDKREWIPRPSDRVCSEHFVDGIPTEKNPNPSLKLGYEIQKSQPRREIKKHPIIKKVKKATSNQTSSSNNSGDCANNIVLFEEKETLISSPPPLNNPNDVPSISDHYYCSENVKECGSCKFQKHLAKSYRTKIYCLNKHIKKLSVNNAVKINMFSWRDIKTDEKMNFYTGITSIAIFEKIFEFIEPFPGQYTGGVLNELCSMFEI